MPTEWIRHRASATIATLTALVAASLAMGPPAGAQASSPQSEVPEVVARVGDRTVDRAALLEEAKAALAQVETQRAQCEQEATRDEHTSLEKAADRLVKKQLFSVEAERRGLSEEGLREELRKGVAEVSDGDVDEFYEQNKGRIRGTKEEVGEQIRAFIQQQRMQKAESDFFAEIEKNVQVELFLEPLRVEVAASGAAKGPDAAPVTIVEFSDFECPYCQRVLPTLEQVEEKYGEKVRVVYRHFPLSIHPNAQKAAEASLCAWDQGKFWEMHDLLFAEQQKLGADDLKEKAVRLGLDAGAFASCLDSNRHYETVQADLEAGSSAGVNGTPAFFINGRFVSGAVPFETLSEVIDDEIRRSQRN